MLDLVTRLAIANGVKVAKGETLKPGAYPVDTEVTLKVTGSITKGADEEYTPTVAIPLKAVLMIAIEKSGIMRDHIEQLVIDAMLDALKDDAQAEAHIAERIKQVDAMEKRVQDMLAALPKKTRTGKTLCDITVVEV